MPLKPPVEDRYDDLILNTPNLVGYWPLREFAGTVARDLSKNKLNLTYANGYSLGKGGPSPGMPGVKLSGATDTNAMRADNALMDTANTAVTLELWCKRVGTGANMGLMTKGTGGWYLRFNASNQLDFLRSEQLDLATSTTTITDTVKWHHCAVTYAGANGAVALYIDGANAGLTTVNATEALISNASNFAVGSDVQGNIDPIEEFNGYVALAALYTRALSAGEIQDRWYLAGIA